MNIKLPSAETALGNVFLGFFAFFGWTLASWLNGFIPWPG